MSSSNQGRRRPTKLLRVVAATALLTGCGGVEQDRMGPHGISAVPPDSGDAHTCDEDAYAHLDPNCPIDATYNGPIGFDTGVMPDAILVGVDVAELPDTMVSGTVPWMPDCDSPEVIAVGLAPPPVGDGGPDVFFAGTVPRTPDASSDD
jgi:hypothetical protein